MKAKKKPITKQSSRFSVIRQILFKIIYYFLIISVGSVILFKFVPIPITLTMIERKLSAESGQELYYEWTSYDNISKEAPLAVVAAEDQEFPNHFGFDFDRMGTAFSNNLKGKKIRGASTISQQVAKNVFLWQNRDYLRKALEVYFTFLIELIWGKQRILEVYLNVAEMGNMTFGVEATANRFFGVSAKNLSREQSARIAAVLPSPIKWSIKNPGGYVARRTNHIARQMRALGGVSYISGLRKF